MKLQPLRLDQRSAFEIVVRAFIQKGFKERAFKIVFNIFRDLKFSKKVDPFKLFHLALNRTEMHFELRVNKFIKPPKKQKGRPKLRGRLFYVSGPRVRRLAIKDLLKNSLSRSEGTVSERIVEEVSDICSGKGVTIRKKKALLNSIYGARATLEVVKRHRRRKRISRL